MSNELSSDAFAEDSGDLPNPQNTMLEFGNKFGGRLKNVGSVKRLYHYTNTEGLFGIISTGELWASEVSYLNDKSENFYSRKVSERTIKKLSNDENDKLLRRFLDVLAHLLGSYRNLPEPDSDSIYTNDYKSHDTYVVSLCEKRDLLSQWRGYSGNGSGHSIGLDVERLNNNLQGYHLVPIIYEPALQHDIAENVVMKSLKYLRKRDFSVFDGMSLSEEAVVLNIALWTVENLDFLGLRFKDESFIEENEWRLIERIPRTVRLGSGLPAKTSPSAIYRNDRPLINFRTRGSQLVPYATFRLRSAREVAIGFQDDKNPITDITVGPGNDFEKARYAINHLFAYCGLHPATHEILRSKIPYAVPI